MTLNIGVKPLTETELSKSACAARDVIDNPGANAREVALAALGAFYRQRFGPAPGSSASCPDTGETAVRFYDSAEKGYCWCVNPGPTATGQTRSYVEGLPHRFAGHVHEVEWSKVLKGDLR